MIALLVKKDKETVALKESDVLLFPSRNFTIVFGFA